jgi:hypothetical protein
MFIMIGTYMIMGFVKLDTTGNGSATWGTFPYPKTAFLPFGSTVSARSLILTVCSALLLLMIVSCVSLPPGAFAGVQFAAPCSPADAAGAMYILHGRAEGTLICCLFWRVCTADLVAVSITSVDCGGILGVDRRHFFDAQREEERCV